MSAVKASVLFTLSGILFGDHSWWGTLRVVLGQSFLQLLCCSVGKGQKQIQTDPLPRLKNLSLRILPKKSFLPFRMYRTLPYWSISFAPIRIDRLNAKSNGKSSSLVASFNTHG